MWDEFYPVIDQVIDIRAPILVLHGTDDKTIPVEMGKKIAERAHDVTLKLYDGGHHNDLRLFGAGVDIQAFIETVMSKP